MFFVPTTWGSVLTLGRVDPGGIWSRKNRRGNPLEFRADSKGCLYHVAVYSRYNLQKISDTLTRRKLSDTIHMRKRIPTR